MLELNSVRSVNLSSQTYVLSFKKNKLYYLLLALHVLISALKPVL